MDSSAGVYFVKVGDKEIPEKDYHPACNRLHKLVAKIRSRAVEIWENKYPDLTPEQALIQAIQETLQQPPL